ncbi:hypothetical protein DSAG12_01447 [Promethearchaeum syntrophicum]|uniref:Uncharacterized protein n=1 Tax=Promethearchaeum syntrophicum TaxID=2594042 RepID=A0A5B9D9B6_9ARCH|nr:hypothetical protein [Candidatus Prometheoarchaeum syntrophicum]
MSKTKYVYWETLENRKKVKKKKWMKKFMKNKITTLTLEEILKEVNRHQDYFLSIVDENHSIHYLNGFVGVGALKEPRDHLGYLNTIVMYSCGYNLDGSEIKKLSEQEFTLEEAEDMVEVLKICIERYKEREHRKKD